MPSKILIIYLVNLYISKYLNDLQLCLISPQVARCAIHEQAYG